MDSKKIKVYGARWCGDCFRTKMVLDRNRINYHWIDINKDKAAKEFVAQVNDGNYSVPTIVFQDGTILVEPSMRELKEKLGLLKSR